MIIRNLQATSRNLLLGTAFLTSVMFTSCSRTLTSLRSADKLQNQQELSQPSQTLKAPLATITPEKQTVQPVAEAKKDQPTPATVQKHEFRKWADSKTKLVMNKTKLVKNLITSNVDKTFASIQGIDKSKNMMSANHSAQPMRDLIRLGIMCIIISLVLYLIAWLLFFADPISTLFYVLATLFLIFGIVFLLFGLLRMM